MPKKNNKTQDKLSKNQLIALMGIYESEFEYRDTVLYSRMFSLFYASLIIMLFPFVTKDLPIFDLNIPTYIFITLGMICELLSFFISIVHADRLRKSSATYQKIINMLPEEYRRLSTLDSDNIEHKIPLRRRITNIKLTYFVPIVFFILTICLGIILLFIQFNS